MPAPHGPHPFCPSVFSATLQGKSQTRSSPYLLVWPQCRFRKMACVRKQHVVRACRHLPHLLAGKKPQTTHWVSGPSPDLTHGSPWCQCHALPNTFISNCVRKRGLMAEHLLWHTQALHGCAAARSRAGGSMGT